MQSKDGKRFLCGPLLRMIHQWGQVIVRHICNLYDLMGGHLGRPRYGEKFDLAMAFLRLEARQVEEDQGRSDTASLVPLQYCKALSSFRTTLRLTCTSSSRDL